MNYTMGNNASATMSVNEMVFSEPTYTKNEFTFYGGDGSCSVFYVGK
jgi:hypothetical protein